MEEDAPAGSGRIHRRLAEFSPESRLHAGQLHVPAWGTPFNDVAHDERFVADVHDGAHATSADELRLAKLVGSWH